MQLLEKKHKKVIINITSLIDVSFLLLIFLLVSTTFREQPGMKLELPETKSNTPERMENIVLEITANEQLILNNERIGIDQLENKFKELMSSINGKSLVLKADKNVSHGTVVNIMDLAKISGMEKIIIATTSHKEQ